MEQIIIALLLITSPLLQEHPSGPWARPLGLKSEADLEVHLQPTLLSKASRFIVAHSMKQQRQAELMEETEMKSPKFITVEQEKIPH